MCSLQPMIEILSGSLEHNRLLALILYSQLG